MCRIDSWSAMQILQHDFPTCMQLVDRAVALAKPFAKSCAGQSVLCWIPLTLRDRSLKVEVEIQLPNFAQFKRGLLRIEQKHITFSRRPMFPDRYVEVDEYGEVPYGIFGLANEYAVMCIRRNTPLNCITVQFS